jgi:hypothetical protein
LVPFADAAEPLTTAARVLLGDQSNPGREVATWSEAFRITHACDERGGEQRTDTWNAIKAFARLIGTVPSQDHSIKFQDLLFEAEQLAVESHKAGAHKLGHPLLAAIGNDT